MSNKLLEEFQKSVKRVGFDKACSMENFKLAQQWGWFKDVEKTLQPQVKEQSK